MERLGYPVGYTADVSVATEPSQVRGVHVLIDSGHRLRLQISSSNFPKFDRNPNHGGDIPRAGVSDYVTANQTIFHDSARPSRLIVPVVP